VSLSLVGLAANGPIDCALLRASNSSLAVRMEL
jgi:hypothetical protein